MHNSNSNNKRIAKNTLLLYVRMFVMLIVSLYTSRIVLQTLGVNDFGLYNIVGGIVVLFSILNEALSSSTQRFLNYSLGKNNIMDVMSIFRCSKSLHLLLITIVVLLAETIGVCYINFFLNVPEGRLSAANWIYQFSVITFCLNIYRVPYNASIIAHEKMNFYAYISVIEAVLKLLIVFLLKVGNFDKLILYGFLMMLVSFIINQSYIIYCKKSFEDSVSGLEWNKDKMRHMLSFSGWNLFGSVAVIGNQQGINLLLNYFCGVAINAAVGIAGQVTGAIYGFISNFQVAFNPQIVKLYAQDDKDKLFELVFRASKFSILLFWIISLPVLFTTPFILELWLGDVPAHASSFCQIILLYLLVDSLNGPLWTTVNATGEIKKYQITISFILLFNIPLCLLLLSFGLPPESVWLSRLFFNIAACVYRIIFLVRKVEFPFVSYLKKVLFPVVAIMLISYLVMRLTTFNSDTFYDALLVFVISTLTCIALIWTIGMDLAEKAIIKNMILIKIK